MNTNNETARKIGQNIAIGLTVTEQTVIKLAEHGREKTKSAIEKGKSFFRGLTAGFKEVRNNVKIMSEQLKKGGVDNFIEEHNETVKQEQEAQASAEQEQK